MEHFSKNTRSAEHLVCNLAAPGYLARGEIAATNSQPHYHLTVNYGLSKFATQMTNQHSPSIDLDACERLKAIFEIDDRCLWERLAAAYRLYPHIPAVSARAFAALNVPDGESFVNLRLVVSVVTPSEHRTGVDGPHG